MYYVAAWEALDGREVIEDGDRRVCGGGIAGDDVKEQFDDRYEKKSDEEGHYLCQ